MMEATTTKGDPARTWDVSSEAGVLACYDATFDEVYRYCARLTGSGPAAEDLTQDTFVRLVRAAQQSSVRSIGVGWLITTARRLFVDRLRSETSERARLRLVASNPAPVTLPAPDGGDPAELLAGLTGRERAALVFHYVDDLPVAQVAELLGSSVPATESLLQRARRRVRDTTSRGGVR
jgi:RNA polymerase sigma-70 factor (ECF subfamily)